MKNIFVAIIAVMLATGSTLALGVIVGPFGSSQDTKEAISDPVIYNNMGFYLAQQGKNDEAQEAFTTAVELDADYEKARSNLATIAFNNEDYETAIEQLRWLVAHDTSNNNYKFDLAQNLISQARYVDADMAKLTEGATIYESLGDFPNAARNAAIVRNVIADVS